MGSSISRNKEQRQYLNRRREYYKQHGFSEYDPVMNLLLKYDKKMYKAGRTIESDSL